MINTKIKYFFFILFFAVFASCGDDFDELNIDPINPTQVPSETLFASGLRSLARNNSSASVNLNVFRLYSQYWAQTTYPDESQYNQTGRRIPQRYWNNIYITLNNLQDAKNTIENESFGTGEEAKKQNQLAQADILMVYGYSLLLDVFGDIPYSEALNPDNTTPVYDDAATVHADLLNRLTMNINALDESSEGFVSTQDNLYNGDITEWKKFANSLKLRMAMRVSDVNPSLSRSAAEEAISSGIISSNAEAAMYDFVEGSPNSNPLWEALVQSGRKDFVPADTFVDVLKDLEDPRLGVWTTTIGGEYVGGVYGDANNYSSFSNLSSVFENPDLDGTIINYAEVCFLMAEAKLLGYAGPGSAELWYQLGITSSMNEWGISDDAAIAAYIADNPYTGEDSIALQKWISQVDNGLQGWSTWRKFDYPVLNAPPGLSQGDIPTRLLYPSNEGNLNGANYTAAGTAIGGDEKTTKLWWDVN